MSTPPSSVEMPKPSVRLVKPMSSSNSFLSDGVMFLGGALVALLFVWSLWSLASPKPLSPQFPDLSQSSSNSDSDSNFINSGVVVVESKSLSQQSDSDEFVEIDMPDPAGGFGKPITDWDSKRRQWLGRNKKKPSLELERVLLLTGSQPSPCRSPIGDHLLLRFFKNKVDYCRVHGCNVFYNNVLLQPEMFTYWAKYPVIRAAMIAHPEVEWIWWVDSDAAFTDMSFQLPLRRYSAHNLVVHGWTDLIYGPQKSWYGLNAGVFLIRNCQWSMELMERWASMGPISPDYPRWGQIQKSVFPDKLFPESDDQTGLLYLLVKERDRWGDKVYIENDYYFEGYWMEIVGNLKNLTTTKTETAATSHSSSSEYNYYDHNNKKNKKPFVTHFTGCQPCSGRHNDMYSDNSCLLGMEMALNFADNQVLSKLGYFHPDLLNASLAEPLPSPS